MASHMRPASSSDTDQPEAVIPEAPKHKAVPHIPEIDLDDESPADTAAAAPEAVAAAQQEDPLPLDETQLRPVPEAPDPEDPGFEVPEIPESPEAGEPAEKPKKRRHLLWIVPAALVVLLGGAYAGGAVYFESTFMPGTTLDGEDVSLRPVEEVAAEKSASLDDYRVHVSGKGLDLTVTAEQAGLTCDGESYAAEALSQVNPWAWPLEIASPRELSAAAAVSFDREKVAAVVAPAVEQLAASSTVEGHGISYSPEAAAFVLDEGAVATSLDAELVTDAVAQAIQAGETEVVIGDECVETDTAVQDAVNAANTMVGAAVTLNLGGTNVAVVTSDMIAGWITIGDDLSVSFDSAAVEQWTRGDLSAQLDTIGTDRTYTRPDGATFTVTGTTSGYGASTYGWSIDGKALAEQIAANVQSGQPSTIDIPCVSTAAKVNPGGQDWPDRYIDVDLTAQHAVFYDNGTVIWEADITTGQPNLGQETPTGVWTVTNRKSRATDGDINLKGPIDPETGEPEWDSHVDFWLGFVGNLVGFHNAPWQSVFGGDIYTYYGSHGCIRMSYADGQALYNVGRVGDVVVVHK